MCSDYTAFSLLETDELLSNNKLLVFLGLVANEPSLRGQYKKWIVVATLHTCYCTISGNTMISFLFLIVGIKQTSSLKI